MLIVDKIIGLPLPTLNHWGYWIILLFAMLEAIPLFGLFAPGMLIIVIGGFLAKTGILEIGDVIFVASLGAIIGDLIGYLLGRNYGPPFITRFGKYFFFKKDNFEKTKKLMNKHSGKTIIIGRFNSLTRAFAPFIAGSTKVPFVKFLAYNIIGGISWAISFVMVGYIFGKSYEVASKYIGGFFFAAIIVSILIVYVYKFINKRRHIFTKYHLYALILNIFSLYLFSKMLEDVIAKELVTKLDVLINDKIMLLWNPTLTKLMVFITSIANATTIISLSILLLFVLLYKKKFFNATLLVSSMTFGLISELLIKLILHRERPLYNLIPFGYSLFNYHYSFPSGHATMATIFFSLLLYSFKDDIKNKILKHIFIYSNITLFLLIGFSRIYLNVHWFSDVIAGFSLGIFWLTLFILVFKIITSLSKKMLDPIKNFLEKHIP